VTFLHISADGNSRKRTGAIGAIATLIAALLTLMWLGVGGPAKAGMGGGGGAVAATQTANAGLAACSNNSGRALYDCVANVLDRLGNSISGRTTREALSTAASQLRAAVNKAQALSAITQCRAVIAGTLRQVRASGGEGSGLGAIAGVLAQAARLIQSKG
jgi:hypothetical protein